MSEQPAVGFAELLRQRRAEAMLTQEELATAAGLSTRTVSDLERGINLTARKATAELLAGALRLSGDARERFVAVARGKSGPVMRAAGGLFAARTPGAVPGGRTGPGLSTGNGTGSAHSSGAALDERADDADASNIVWIESAASGRLVGRERELGVLREAWSSATTGRRVLALAAGEPGIGKTALVAELAREVREEAGLVLYGRWDEHVLAPYQAFREALRDYTRACPDAVLRKDLAGLAGEISVLCPEPARRIGVPPAPPLSAEAERFRLFESLGTWIARITTRHPVLFVLDDLQWADEPSLLLLPYLMRAQRSTPLLVVAMYRDTGPRRDDFPAVLASLTRDIDCRRLPLRGLADEAVARLLSTVLPAEMAGRLFGEGESAVVAELRRETAGNPFFLLEMARHLALGETLAQIPESVRDMVRSRLRRLSDRCAEILAIASLVGERFDAALLAEAAGLDDAATIAALEEADQAGLVTELGDDTDSEPDHWRFQHSLTRRVTAEELSRSRRARLHHRIGETLESRPGVPPARLAHHFGAAAKGAAEKAAGYERLAGERALREVAAEVAVRHFTRALELLDRFRTEDQRPRCELLLELARAHDRAGEYTPRDERFAEAADVARQLGNDGLFLWAALGYGGVLPATVQPDPRAQALLEQALDLLGESDTAARAMVLARLAHWLHTTRPYPERLALSDRSLSLARAAGDRRTLATVLLHRCWALDGPDDVADALRVSGETLAIGDELTDPELRLEGLRIRLAAEFESGAHAAAMATAHDMKALAERMRHPEFIRLASMWDITVANLEGRFADAERLTGALGRRLNQIGHPQAQFIPLVQTFAWRLLRGHAAEYIPVLEAMSATDPENLVWAALTAWCLASTGARDATAGLLHGTDPALAADADKNYLWWGMIAGLAGAASRAGDRRWAAALYDLAAPYAGNNCTLGVATFLGAADHWLGVLAATAGRPAAAVAHLRAALARHRDMGSRPWTALTQDAYGRVLSARGEAADTGRAQELTRSAMRTAGELGLTVISRGELLTHQGGRPSPAARPGSPRSGDTRRRRPVGPRSRPGERSRAAVPGDSHRPGSRAAASAASAVCPPGGRCSSAGPAGARGWSARSVPGARGSPRSAERGGG
jgi:DNA-binding XRE family transcriptional regulator/tetratricopeptide (TPR) repeat protein